MPVWPLIITRARQSVSRSKRSVSSTFWTATVRSTCTASWWPVTWAPQTPGAAAGVGGTEEKGGKLTRHVRHPNWKVHVDTPWPLDQSHGWKESWKKWRRLVKELLQYTKCAGFCIENNDLCISCIGIKLGKKLITVRGKNTCCGSSQGAHHVSPDEN